MHTPICSSPLLENTIVRKVTIMQIDLGYVR